MHKIINLIERWENIARRKFADGESESDPMGKRLIEHGAICYTNCALELRVCIGRERVYGREDALKFAEQELERNTRGTGTGTPVGILNCPDLTPEEMVFVGKREV